MVNFRSIASSAGASRADMLDEEGRLSGFYDDLVIRYLDTVTVLDDGYEVNFKAGLTVKVNAG